MSSTKFAIDIDELRELASSKTREICMELLPNGRENHGYWEIGSVAGEPGQSMKVNLRGGTQGLWTDFSAAPKTPEYAGNIIQLVAQVRFGGNVGHACQWLRSYMGLDDLDPNRLAAEKARARARAEKSDEDARARADKNRRRAHQLFLSASPYPGTIVETYLCSRGLDFRARGLKAPGAIRFHPEVYCVETQSKLPAMVASIVSLEGHHLGTHRTWLQRDGSGKATLIEAKKSIGKYLGGFIPLWKGKHKHKLAELPGGTPIFISEGIEDGLSAAIARPEIRCIAGVALSNIGSIELPPQCPIHLLGQRDEKQKAIDSFERAVTRLQDRGYQVFLHYPPEGVKDYNDLLRRDADANRGESK